MYIPEMIVSWTENQGDLDPFHNLHRCNPNIWMRRADTEVEDDDRNVQQECIDNDHGKHGSQYPFLPNHEMQPRVQYHGKARDIAHPANLEQDAR